MSWTNCRDDPWFALLSLAIMKFAKWITACILAARKSYNREAILGILQVKAVGSKRIRGGYLRPPLCYSSFMPLSCDQTKPGRLWERDWRWSSRELKTERGISEMSWSSFQTGHEQDYLPVVAVAVVLSVDGETLKKLAKFDVYLLFSTQCFLIVSTWPSDHHHHFFVSSRRLSSPFSCHVFKKKDQNRIMKVFLLLLLFYLFAVFTTLDILQKYRDLRKVL